MTTIRNRVVERRRMKGSDLTPHPRNWRKHPQHQADALKGVLTEIGQVGELYAYRSARNGGKLTLIDGHLRGETFAGEEWDVAVTDLDDAEADKLLLIFDPLSAMATADASILNDLLKDVSSQDKVLADLLEKLGKDNPLPALADGAGAPDQSGTLSPKFQVLVECSTEKEQADLLAKLTKEGRTCRSLIC